MKTVRRHVADPMLRWGAAGPDHQYRIAVQNEETGVRRTVYEGFRRDCKLPADLRLTPDQLSFRVESRPSDEDGAAYQRRQEFTLVPRIGDDLSPDAEDVLSRDAVAGASAYRLQVRDIVSLDRIIDMVGKTPHFLLPPGQLMDRASEWNILAEVGGVWRKQRWKPVTSGMIAAAQARAATLIEVAEAKRGRLRPEATSHPAVLRSTLSSAPAHPASMAIVVPVTAQPVLAWEPTGESVTSVQWSDGRGGGAAERAAILLENQGMTGWFFLDIEQALSLGIEAMGRLAGRLMSAGHRVGLYVGDGALAPRATPQERLARMMEGLEQIGVPRHGAVMLGEGKYRASWLDMLVEAGVPTVILSRQAQLTLPGWRRWRMAPFLTAPGTIVLPAAMFLSTPAHARDRAVRHQLANGDALAGGSVGAALDAAARFCGDQTLTLVQIDPMLLLDRRRINDRVMTDVWNTTVKQSLPQWLKAGWIRSTKGFEIARGDSEVQRELLQGMLRGLAASKTPWADWDDVADAARVSGWLPPSPAFEPLIEQRRGPRRFRASAARRYDNSYRLALGASS